MGAASLRRKIISKSLRFHSRNRPCICLHSIGNQVLRGRNRIAGLQITAKKSNCSNAYVLYCTYVNATCMESNCNRFPGGVARLLFRTVVSMRVSRLAGVLESESDELLDVVDTLAEGRPGGLDKSKR